MLCCNYPAALTFVSAIQGLVLKDLLTGHSFSGGEPAILTGKPGPGGWPGLKSA